MNHLFILLRILSKIGIYILVPGLMYLVLYLGLYFAGLRNISDPFSTLIIDICTLVAVIYCFNLYKKEVFGTITKTKLQIKKLLALIPLSILARVPLFVVLIVLLIIFGDIITETVDQGIEYQWSVFDGSTWYTTLFGFASFVILGPIHEELLYRGVIQQYLYNHYSKRTSIIYASVLFALIHIQPGLIVSSFILGLALGYIYLRWNNIYYAIGLHMLINLQPFILQILAK